MHRVLIALLFAAPLTAAATPSRWFIHYDDGVDAAATEAAVDTAVAGGVEPELRFRGQANGLAATMTTAAATQAAKAPGVALVARQLTVETATGGGVVDLDFVSTRPGEAVLGEHALFWNATTRAVTLPTAVDPYAEPANRNVVLVSDDDRRRLHAVVEDPAGTAMVRIGIDLNGDGQPSLDEERCASPSIEGVASCDVLRQSAAAPYWIMASTTAPSASPVVVVHGMVLEEFANFSYQWQSWLSADGVTAPDGSASMRWSIDKPQLRDNASLLGAVQIKLGSGFFPAPHMRVPVRVVRRGIEQVPHVLLPGELAQYSTVVRKGDIPRALIFDVDHGSETAGVSIGIDSGADMRLAVWHDPAPDYSGPAIRENPGIDAPGVRIVKPTGTGGSVIFNSSVDGPLGGRWYAMPVNMGTTDRVVRLNGGWNNVVQENTFTIEPGSYYDPKRPGHGLFVYPAGDQLVMLWYTYDDDGRATWYYAQGPEKEGGSRSYDLTLNRTAWRVDRQQHYPIGQVRLTATAKKKFTMTWQIDGVHGTSMFEPFLSGCPSVGGTPLDISGHWFDPARSGSGYSVQVAPNYEFFAAFLYDHRGRPRFLAAERGGPFAAGSPVIELHQLHGFGPLAPWQAPVRTPVGTLQRSYLGGTLDTVAVDATFADGVGGTWKVLDDVQPLTATQGCAP